MQVISGLLLLPSSFAQAYDSLTFLKGYKTKVYYSAGNENRAALIADRCDKVMVFYKSLIAFEPVVKVLILDSADWKRYTKFPVYGMPHYNDNQTLIIASADNDFWKSFVPPLEKLSKDLAEQISRTYNNGNGTLTMQPFFDLLAIHELGHAFHSQGGLIMQRKWMGELFANLLLHTYIAEVEPQQLPALTVFPKMVIARGRDGLKYTSLNDLENRYDEIGEQYPQNYGWYQSRWHSAAGEIYSRSGTEAFTKLWEALKTQKNRMNDDALASFLSNHVHQSVADVLLKWDE